jgi:hypothetical protein
MTDIQPQSAPPRDNGDDDPLRKLHKMSRTAGLGDSQYVAVNAFAVAAIIFGLASGLVVVNPILLIVPAVAVVLGVIALMQVRNSNGTQTGRALAWLGIVLAVGASVLLGTSHVLRILNTRQDEQQVAQLIAALGVEVSARNYDAAHARLSARLAETWPKDAFAARMNLIQDGAYGPIKGMKWNGRAAFEVDPRTRAPVGMSVAVIERTQGAEDRQEMRFVRADGQWKVDAIPMFLPIEQPQPSAKTLQPARQ